MGSAEDASGGKRKRDEGQNHERKATKAARHATARQERLEREFAETYQGLTALYKLLEIKQLQSPLLLPRTLSYRLDKAAAGERKKTAPAPAAGADVREIKLGITSDLRETLARENRRLGLRLAIYSAKGRAFADNSFTLAADCMVPVPCSKDIRIPADVLPQGADVIIATFQVLEIGELADQLAEESEFVFAAPSSSAQVVLGKDVLSTSVDGRTPLYGNLLRINPSQRRTGSFEVELAAISSTMGGGVKCQFVLSWDSVPNTGKINRLDRIFNSKFNAKSTAEPVDGEPFMLAIPKRDFHTTNDRRDCTGVWFHFLYHFMLRRLSEKRPDYSCAWCNMYAGSLRGLVAHLVSSHDRFRFQATVGHDNIPHIYVMVVDKRPPATLSNGIARSALCELETNRDEGLDRFELHFSYLSPKKWGEKRAARLESAPSTKAVDALMHEFDDLDEAAQDPQEFYAPLLQRQYFHSRTGAVVLDHEKDYDSDDDVDEEWIIQQSEKLLDEFEDVALEEKEFMKKWNRHAKEFRIISDFMVASSCRLFAKRHGKWLADHGLRYNFLLHLLNLWDNSLLNSRAIIDCMLIADRVALTEAAIDTDESTPAPVPGAAAATTPNGTN